jgi:hypothetical protein
VEKECRDWNTAPCRENYDEDLGHRRRWIRFFGDGLVMGWSGFLGVCGGGIYGDVAFAWNVPLAKRWYHVPGRKLNDVILGIYGLTMCRWRYPTTSRADAYYLGGIDVAHLTVNKGDHSFVQHSSSYYKKQAVIYT